MIVEIMIQPGPVRIRNRYQEVYLICDRLATTLVLRIRSMDGYKLNELIFHGIHFAFAFGKTSCSRGSTRCVFGPRNALTGRRLRTAICVSSQARSSRYHTPAECVKPSNCCGSVRCALHRRNAAQRLGPASLSRSAVQADHRGGWTQSDKQPPR